tara:strand:- start:6431 stop:6796 length:366 start_codon:yes stop_codon:yes gene_type:complete
MLTIKNKKMPKFKANTNFKMSGFPKFDFKSEKPKNKRDYTAKEEMDYSPHNISARRTEGTIKQQEQRRNKRDGFPAGQTAGQIIRRERLMLKKKDPCWKGYEMIGMKKKGGREVPNCVPKN